MIRTFRNPNNGHTEQVGSDSWVYVVIFGAFYLAYRGLWVHFFIWIITVGGFSVITGGPGLIVALPIATIAYGVSIQGILTKSYLRRGWEEVHLANDGNVEQIATTQNGLRECPYCAELIKTQAVKCKHCGSEIEPIKPGPIVEVETQKSTGEVVQFWVVALPYRNNDEYIKAKEKLILTGVPVYSETGHYLRVGPYPSKDEAGSMLRKLMQSSLHGNIEEVLQE